MWFQSAKTTDLKRWISGGLVYRYVFSGKYKIYNPYKHKRNGKWLSNTTLNSVQGLDYLPDGGDMLILTKSYKDVIIINEYMEIPSIAFQSENSIPSDKVVKYFKGKFKEVIILYDNDEPGIEAAKKFSALHGLPYMYIPLKFNSKDVSDLVKNHGILTLKFEFVNMLKKLNI